MNFILVIFAIIICLLIGVGLTYWSLQKTIKQQKLKYLEQNRKTVEELEKIHESRMRETINSLQSDYQNRLTKETEELKTKHENHLQETIIYLKINHQTQLAQKQNELEQIRESLARKEVNEWQDGDKSQRQQVVKQSLGTEVQLKGDFRDKVSEKDSVKSNQKEQQPQQESPADSNSLVYFQNFSDISSQKEQDLSQKIIAWGDSGEVTYISQLTEYIHDSESEIRKQVASALGKIAASKAMRVEIRQAIPMLGKLSRDPDPLVRQSSVEALGKIKSEKVISLLKLALRDSDSDVVKSASAALTNFKFYQRSRQKKPTNLRRIRTSYTSAKFD